MTKKNVIKRKVPMGHKVVIFSTLLFLFIAVAGSAAFVVLMERVMHADSGGKLSKTVELERLKLENHVNGELAMVLKLADSPLMKRYFENPDDAYLEELALESLVGYRETFAGKTMFWVNDKDKKFYADGAYAYDINPGAPDTYWYNKTIYGAGKFNFNIDYDPSLNSTNLWINAPVFDKEGKAIAIVGTGVDLTAFLTGIYGDYSGDAALYFFNAEGEITGAENAALAAEKRKIYDVAGAAGQEIFAKALSGNGGKIQRFNVDGWNGVAAVGKIPMLGWYAAAVLPFNIMDALRTEMTVLFVVMMLILAASFVVVNLFVTGLLAPLTNMVSSINKITSEWDARQHKDEIGVLGEFIDMALVDPLTGIRNRRYMEETMNSLIKTMRRSGGGALSALMVDVDCFKKYNDAYGHAEGDNCLRAVAKAIEGSVTRDDDFAARYGGEEFAVILPNTDLDGAKIIAERILKNVRERNIPHEKNDAAGRVTVSIGIASGDAAAVKNGAELICRADKALYLSKKHGRDRITCCDGK